VYKAENVDFILNKTCLKFFISNFGLVLNVVFLFFFGDSLTSEFYGPTFQNTVCTIFIGGVSMKNKWDDIARIFILVKFWLKIA